MNAEVIDVESAINLATTLSNYETTITKLREALEVADKALADITIYESDKFHSDTRDAAQKARTEMQNILKE